MSKSGKRSSTAMVHAVDQENGLGEYTLCEKWIAKGMKAVSQDIAEKVTCAVCLAVALDESLKKTEAVKTFSHHKIGEAEACRKELEAAQHRITVLLDEQKSEKEKLDRAIAIAAEKNKQTTDLALELELVKRQRDEVRHECELRMQMQIEADRANRKVHLQKRDVNTGSVSVTYMSPAAECEAGQDEEREGKKVRTETEAERVTCAACLQIRVRELETELRMESGKRLLETARAARAEKRLGLVLEACEALARTAKE